jgi:hypothetical protein
MDVIDFSETSLSTKKKKKPKYPRRVAVIPFGQYYRLKLNHMGLLDGPTAAIIHV